MRKRTWMVGTVAVGFTVTSLTTAYADVLSQKRSQAQQLQSQVTRLQQQIEKDQQQESSYKKQLDSLTASLNTVHASLVDNQKQYSAVLSQVNQLQTKIQQNQQNLNKSEDELAAQLRYMYESGGQGYLDVLFGAQSFSDFLSRLSEMAMVGEQQHQIIQAVQSLQQQLTAQQAALKSDQKTLEQRRAQLLQAQAMDQSLQAAKAAALQNIKNQETKDKNAKYTVESQLKLTQAQIAEIEAETQAAEQKMQSASYVAQTQSTFTNVSADALIHYAEQFIGLPYVWGGTTPNPGFDCSGFTQYVFAHFGVALNRTAAEQFAQGIPVSRGNLQPGDLVFFSTYAPGATHVGIYVGNGMMINSEDSGLMITSMSLPYWSSRYIGARRVMNAT
ncbi:C40 family peptidase [Alicyclobacillus contaminans]|uniref:C40 family peptidase n=1 Tax=Alicyclobacillus contaminans TaxID=392016 RepID=UPI00146FA513|nr:C40 family peptidase [Alicyclobacillus contaminans]